jgi:hypothetical protein
MCNEAIIVPPHCLTPPLLTYRGTHRPHSSPALIARTHRPHSSPALIARTHRSHSSPALIAARTHRPQDSQRFSKVMKDSSGPQAHSCGVG